MSGGARTSPHAVVLASAGTGKTFRLTTRFIRVLSAGVDPALVLATTFTRKASAEILDRLLRMLCRAATGDAETLAVLREHASPALTAESCRAIVARLAARVDRLGVQTLDAFFARLAGTVGLDVGLPPGWEIAEDGERQELARRALRDVLESGEQGELLKRVQSLTQGLPSGIFARLAMAIENARAVYLKSGESPAAWDVVPPPPPGLSDSELDAAIEALRAAPVSNFGRRPNSKVVKARDRLAALAEAGDWWELLCTKLGERCREAQHQFDGKPVHPPLTAAVRVVAAHARTKVLEQFRDRNRAMALLLRDYQAAFDRRKLARGRFEFDDIPRRLLRGAVAERLTDAYFRLDGRIDHVLLDEFQDTSVAQFELVRPILDELLADGTGARSVFCVGDAKQSLYTWRDAEPGLLASLPARWPAFGEPVTMAESFRSSPAVLRAVNRVFGSLRTSAVLAKEPAAHDAATDFSRTFQTHTAHKQLAGVVRVLSCTPPVVDDDKEQKAATNEAHAALVAERVAAVMAASPTTTVGVLVRANRHTAPIMRELARRGIEASEEGGSPLTDAAPAAVALSALWLADHPGDTACAFHVATSPLGAMLRFTKHDDPDARARFSRGIRRMLLRRGYAVTLERWRRRLASRMDARELGRFWQLVDLARDWDASPSVRPSGFVRAARAARVQSPSPRRVSVLTIHKAKGLEFDAVVLPELDGPWKAYTPCIAVVEEGRPPVATVWPGKAERLSSPELQRLVTAASTRYYREELCVLYVAMTRAKHVLEILLRPDEKEPRLNAAGVVRAALGLADVPPGLEMQVEVEGAGAPARPLALALSDSVADGVDSTEVASTSTPADESALPQIKLVAGASTPLWRLRRRSPSSLEGTGSVTAVSVVKPAGALAKERGVLLHAWFEEVEWLDEGPPTEKQLRDAAAKNSCRPELVESELAPFRQSLKKDLGPILRRARYATRPGVLQLFREQPFAVAMEVPGLAPRAGGTSGKPTIPGAAALVTGRFDRLVVGWEGDRALWAEVLDFKTDAFGPKDEIFLAARAAHYEGQVRAYMRAACRMLRLDSSQVTGALVFTSASRVVPFDLRG
jgi:ATP-dependent exoDNAse (exonuclease V) beta subunit